MNIRFFIILGLLLSATKIAVAKNEISPLLKCLAMEEYILHKNRISGPQYKLNQLFMNEMAETDNIHLKTRYVQEICNKKSNLSPSINFLKLLLIENKKIFKISDPKENPTTYHYQLSTTEGLQLNAFKIFFRYLSFLQYQAPTPECLKEEIPEIGYYLEQFKYLESDYSPKEILKDKAKLRSIFNKLESFDKITKKCKKRSKKKKKK